jgi:hypothetical protein
MAPYTIGIFQYFLYMPVLNLAVLRVKGRFAGVNGSMSLDFILSLATKSLVVFACAKPSYFYYEEEFLWKNFIHYPLISSKNTFKIFS